MNDPRIINNPFKIDPTSPLSYFIMYTLYSTYTITFSLQNNLFSPTQFQLHLKWQKLDALLLYIKKTRN